MRESENQDNHRTPRENTESNENHEKTIRK